jgi:serine/threonine-protein kinase
MSARCLSEETIAAALDGALSNDRRDGVFRHLDGCPACRRFVAFAANGQQEEVPAELPETLSPGARVGRYVVDRLLGRGGVGVVYAAYDEKLQRRVALKVLAPSRLVQESLERLEARLLREAQAMAQLSHVHVVSVFDVERVGDRVFLAMELFDGDTLQSWLKEDHRGWREVLEKFLQAGEGLAAAHHAGMVHRDFKPGNVLLSKSTGRVAVSDFGLVSAEPLGRLLPVQRASAADAPERTATQLAGTPRYMAPEQLEGKRVDARADQFAFCVALSEALFDALPSDDGAVDAPTKQGANVPRRLRRALARGLSRDPAQRFASLDALLAELRASARVSRLRRWGAVAGLLLLIGGAGWAVVRSARYAAMPNVVPPGETLFGLSPGSWLGRYVTWQMSLTAGRDPMRGQVPWSEGQKDPVWFLGGVVNGMPGEDLSRFVREFAVKVPAGTGLAIVAFMAFCESFDEVPGPRGGSRAEQYREMRECAKKYQDNVAEVRVELDGVPVPGDPATDYRVESGPVAVTAPEGPTADPLHDGIRFQREGMAAADGTVVLLHPLSPGKHVVHTLARVKSSPNGPVNPRFLRELTFHIEVVP